MCPSPRCVMYRKNEETSNHFFIHCDFAAMWCSCSWAQPYGAANIHWVAPVSCKTLLVNNIFAFRKGREPKAQDIMEVHSLSSLVGDLARKK